MDKRLKKQALLMVIIGAIGLSGCSRQEDFAHSSSVKKSGVEVYRFRSGMAPALPEAPTIAVDFKYLLDEAGIDAPGASASVEKAGSRAYKWTVDDGTKVTISWKECDDGVTCLDKVVIAPATKQQLINKAESWANAKFIEESDYSPWPFTIPYGILRCEKAGAVTIQSDREMWHLNGMAKTWVPSSSDMIEIQKPDPATGAYMFHSKILSDGLALCD